MAKKMNLTQHPATPEQVDAGVIEPSSELKGKVRDLLTFEDIPSKPEMTARAEALAEIVKKEGYSIALVGGAPFFMSTLEKALIREGIKPVYAFSRRESVETTLPDGSVVKKNVFRHLGFVEVSE